MVRFGETHGHLPAAAIQDREGRPLLSWRVAILPFIDQKDLYEEFRLDESWDSPHNAKLVERMPDVFASPAKPAEKSGETRYLAPVGPGTIFAARATPWSLEEISAEIERTLITTSGVTAATDMPRAARPRLGGISFLHRFGSALNHHVHLHACVTDGVFLTTAAEAARDTPPAFLPARPITQADLAALTERAPRRVIRWFRHADLVPARVHPLPKILFTACFVHGLPLRVGRPSAFRASHTC